MPVNEATLIMEDWLKSADLGVSVMLVDRVPRRDQDGLPKEVTIYSDLSDETIANGGDPPRVPALVVMVDFMEPGKATEAAARAGIIKRLLLSVSYLDRDRALVQSKLDGGYVLRAVGMSLTAFHQSRDNTRKELNEVMVTHVRDIHEYRPSGFLGQSFLVGFVAAHIDVLDKRPL